MKDVEKRYRSILHHEAAFADSLAREMIYPPETSRWMILFPFLYFLHLRRLRNYKERLENFSQNFLKTRKLALEHSLEEIRKGEISELTVKNCFPHVDSARHGDVRMCEKQLAEVMILRDHYRKLLRSNAKNYPEMIKKTYRREEALKQFYSRLEKAEHDINRYILKNYQTEKWSEPTVRKMKSAIAKLREQKIKGIF